MAAHVEETKPLESSQIRKRFINPLAVSRLRDLIREQTMDRARSKSEGLGNGSGERPEQSSLKSRWSACVSTRDVPANGPHRETMTEAWTKRAWTRHEGKGVDGS